jgi:hypothetical protein
MKSRLFIISLVAFVMVGCGHQDPIDSIVKKESANPYFGNGMYVPIRLPAAATPEQLTSAVFKQDLRELGSVTNIVEARKIQIMPKGLMDVTNTDFFNYTAVLVDTDIGRKVVLLHYFDGGKNKTSAGWWHEVYDQ